MDKGTGGASAPVKSKAALENLLQSMEQVRSKYDSIPRSDGQFLKALVTRTKRKCALELGSGNGYSAIWIGMGMRANTGRLYTIEINSSIFGQCQENIRRAGIENTVHCIHGNAIEGVEDISGSFDFVFLDLGPVDMLPEFKALESKLTKDTLIAIHNISFEHSYKRLLQYAASTEWVIEKRYSYDIDGFGFFLFKRINNK